MTRLKAEAPIMHPDCEVADCTFERYCEVGRGSRLSRVAMGDYSYCDRYADIANAEVGKFANIAAFAQIGPTDHPLEGAALHHFHYRSADLWDDTGDDAAFFARRRARVARLGHDTWIGHGAVVRPAVTVGHGAVVASLAVVTRHVAPYTIVAGIPARPLRPRQPSPIAERLIALAWWDWDHARLRAALDDFRSLSAEAFLEKHGG